MSKLPIPSLLLASGLLITTYLTPLSPWLVQAEAAEPAGQADRCVDGNATRALFVGQQLAKARPAQSDPDAVIFDAGNATWSGYDSAGKPIRWTVTIRGDYAGGCWHGGLIKGAWNDTDKGITWDDPYHSAGGLSIEVPDFTVESVRIEGQGDGIVTDAGNARLRGVYMTDIHDDCIQNDYLHDVSLEDSFLDGCYVAFSARSWESGVADGSQKLWEIRDSLIRLQPQPVVYAQHRMPTPGHGPFFKWDRDGKAPRVSIHNSIFRADQLPNHGSLGLPPELELADCSNNTLVWLGKGRFPDADKLPDCFKITRDADVWDQAAGKWLASH